MKSATIDSARKVSSSQWAFVGLLPVLIMIIPVGIGVIAWQTVETKKHRVAVETQNAEREELRRLRSRTVMDYERITESVDVVRGGTYCVDWRLDKKLACRGSGVASLRDLTTGRWYVTDRFSADRNLPPGEHRFCYSSTYETIANDVRLVPPGRYRMSTELDYICPYGPPFGGEYPAPKTIIGPVVTVLPNVSRRP